MAGKSKIEWTDASWTPIRARNLKTGKVGWHCEHATTGCINCYSETFNLRLGTGLPFKPGHRKDIEIFLDEEMLLAPLHWKKPRMIFVCSMTDLFADFVKDEWIDRMFAVMGQCEENMKGHVFQILTKRAARQSAYMNSPRAYKSWNDPRLATEAWPPRNIWAGVSAERQQEWDERKEHLRNTPAAVHFASFEPLLGGIIEARPLSDYIQWAIVGGESGPNARPMHPQWVRHIEAQCRAADVRFFFKQWGAWAPQFDECGGPHPAVKPKTKVHVFKRTPHFGTSMVCVGKHVAGRLLDGKEHNGFPEARA